MCIVTLRHFSNVFIEERWCRCDSWAPLSSPTAALNQEETKEEQDPWKWNYVLGKLYHLNRRRWIGQKWGQDVRGPIILSTSKPRCWRCTVKVSTTSPLRAPVHTQNVTLVHEWVRDSLLISYSICPQRWLIGDAWNGWRKEELSPTEPDHVTFAPMTGIIS